MTELKLPLDFERLPEFWQLKEALFGERLKVQDAQIERWCEATAMLLWLRLWVVLGYLARVTCRPGRLNEMGVRQVNCGLYWQLPTSPVDMLVRGGLLRADGDGYFCELFGKTNEHLSGNFLTKEERGNRRSLPARSKNMIAAEAVHQGHLLPPEIFRTRDGQTMDPAAVNRSMILVLNLDRGLKRGQRSKSAYSEGLIADADFVARNTPPETLSKFYEWLAEHFDDPATPKSAEDVLRDWDNQLAAAKKMDGF
jgi:hypothetical protein